ncbi:MAG: rhomboid family intramembrane serine protease [Gemmataceae bacterium]
MRQIATLPEDRAELFSDYLFTLGVETKLDPDGPAAAVWVCDEDKVALARAELESFQREPAAPRYAGARRKAADLRQKQEAAEEEHQEEQEQLQDEMEGGRTPQVAMTVALIALCVVAFSAKRSDEPTDPLYRGFRIDSGENAGRAAGQTARGHWVEVPERMLPDIRAGQPWRLFTPVLLHFGVAHLLPNMLALLYFGGAVEGRLGPGRLLALVLALAAFSNLAEYLLGAGVATADGRTVFITHIYFGGMSGVLYGLFGYIWYKSRYRPGAGLDVPPSVVTVSMVWFVLCWSGAVGPIANVAHTAGLLAGLALGALPDPPVEPVPEEVP